MKVKKRWIILMAVMTLIALAGLAVGEPSFDCDWSVISAADVAWIITATIFVLMMTPGLSFFYGGMVGAKNVISTMLQSFAALAGAIYLGRRSTEKSEPANIPFVLLGAAMLWLGWFGFNAGSSLHADGVAIKAFLNTNTASATAMMTWIFFDCLRGRKPSAMGAAVGCVVGLVAITPSAGYVTVGQSIFIAFVITLICNVAVYWRSRSSIDDALDVFPTHGTGGIFGTVLTGIFIQEGLISGSWEGFVIFLYHLLAIVIVFVYTFAMSWLGYKFIDSLIPMRVSAYSEKVGLDFSQHDEHYGLAHIGERELAEYEEHLREKNKS